MIIDAIRHSPDWQQGDYTTQPQGLRVALEALFFMSSNPLLRQNEMPSLRQADERLDAFVNSSMKTADANDTLYALQASEDYDPGPGLEKITVPLLAVNSADDLINPPELGILESQIQRVRRGKAIVIPLSDQTRGHGTHTMAALWKTYLTQLLKESE
jgi:homoserine O-acetyltransferase